LQEKHPRTRQGGKNETHYEEGGRRPLGEKTGVSTDDKRNMHGQDENKETPYAKGGRRSISEMTRVSADDKISIQGKDKVPTMRLTMKKVVEGQLLR